MTTDDELRDRLRAYGDTLEREVLRGLSTTHASTVAAARPARRRGVLVAAAVVACVIVGAGVAVVRTGDEPEPEVRTDIVEVPAPRGRILDRDGMVLAEDREVDGETTRTYPYGMLAAHVLVAIERSGAVDGEAGRVVHEVDDDGMRGPERTEERTAPVPGPDVTLTIDIDLQYLVERGLAAEVARRRGVMDGGCFLSGGCDPVGAASVALDPATGAVLAMASYPTFDPALLVDPSPETMETLTAEDADDPLLNRAIGAVLAPASTIKPFTAHSGLETGLLTPDLTYTDTGTYLYSADCDTTAVESGCAARNAGGTPHGEVDLARALSLSSDTYWYSLGDRSWRQRAELGEEAIQDGLVEWGFGAPTGIDLPDEAAGRVPTPDWLMAFSQRVHDDPELAAEAGTWTSATSGGLAVGQGDLLVTPLQVARAYAGLATGGALPTPHLIAAEARDVEGPATVDLPGPWREALVEGLDEGTKTGTAARAFDGFDQSSCPVAGKTGTAKETGRNDSSWFAALAPTPGDGVEARIAMATVVERAGFGAAAAVPVTRRVLEPVVSSGCDPTELGQGFAAPLGGAIDVEVAIREFVPPGGDVPD